MAWPRVSSSLRIIPRAVFRIYSRFIRRQSVSTSGSIFISIVSIFVGGACFSLALLYYLEGIYSNFFYYSSVPFGYFYFFSLIFFFDFDPVTYCSIGYLLYFIVLVITGDYPAQPIIINKNKKYSFIKYVDYKYYVK
jgi:hypothetical protein